MRPSVWVSLTLYFYLSIICSDSSAWHEAVLLLLQQEMDACAKLRACEPGIFPAQQQSNGPKRRVPKQEHCSAKHVQIQSPRQSLPERGMPVPRGAAVLSRASSGYQPPLNVPRAHRHGARCTSAAARGSSPLHGGMSCI